MVGSSDGAGLVQWFRFNVTASFRATCPVDMDLPAKVTPSRLACNLIVPCLLAQRRIFHDRIPWPLGTSLWT
jgi:hypothetical protein